MRMKNGAASVQQEKREVSTIKTEKKKGAVIYMPSRKKRKTG